MGAIARRFRRNQQMQRALDYQILIQYLKPDVWYDAGYGIYQDSGLTTPCEDSDDPVARWVDRGSLAKNMARGGADGVTYQTNITNGRPSVRFNGSSGYMTAGIAADWSWLHNGNPATLVFVGKMLDADPEASQAVLETGNTGTSIGANLWHDDAGASEDRMRFIIGDGSGAVVNLVPSNNTWPVQEIHIATLVYEDNLTGDDITQYVDGVSVDADDLTNPSASDPAATLTLGRRATGTDQYANMDVFNVVGWQRRLSNQELSSLWGLLSADFFLASGEYRTFYGDNY